MKIQQDYTWTTGVSEINARKKTMQIWTSWWIRTYHEFIKKAWNNRKTQELKAKMKTFKEKLEEENQNLWDIDPVWYLRRLYYEKKLSLSDILDKVNDKWLNYKDFRWLHYLFTVVFWWKLRDASDLTESQKEWWKKWLRPELIKMNKDVLQSNIEAFQDTLKQIIQSKNKENKVSFCRDIFQSFEWKKSEKHNKVFYLLECYAGISFEDIMLAAEKSGIGARTITRVINTKIEVIKIKKGLEEDLEILVQSISYHLAQRKKKQKTNQ